MPVKGDPPSKLWFGLSPSYCTQSEKRQRVPGNSQGMLPLLTLQSHPTLGLLGDSVATETMLFFPNITSGDIGSMFARPCWCLHRNTMSFVLGRNCRSVCASCDFRSGFCSRCLSPRPPVLGKLVDLIGGKSTVLGGNPLKLGLPFRTFLLFPAGDGVHQGRTDLGAVKVVVEAGLLKRYILQPFETCCFFNTKI